MFSHNLHISLQLQWGGTEHLHLPHSNFSRRSDREGHRELSVPCQLQKVPGLQSDPFAQVHCGIQMADGLNLWISSDLHLRLWIRVTFTESNLICSRLSVRRWTRRIVTLLFHTGPNDLGQFNDWPRSWRFTVSWPQFLALFIQWVKFGKSQLPKLCDTEQREESSFETPKLEH